MKLLKILSLLTLSVSIFLTGCIYDDQEDCPPYNNLSLMFIYPNFDEHINRVTVGIYDAENQLAKSIQVEKNSLETFKGVQLHLPSGDYTAVCWGNAFSNTQINGLIPGDNLSMHRVAHPGYFSSTPIPTNDSLYYGTHHFTIDQNKSTEEPVIFTPAYIRLIIQVKGLSVMATAASSSDYPYIRINNLVPSYNYEMLAQGDLTTYYPAMTVDVVNRVAEMTCDILRFENENPITIDVVENKRTNSLLHSIDLKSFMRSHSINIVAGKEIVIPILITFDKNVNVTLIKEWIDVPTDPTPQQ